MWYFFNQKRDGDSTYYCIVYTRVSQKKMSFSYFWFFEGESHFEYFLESHEENPFWKIGLRIEDYVRSRHLQAEFTRICHEHTKSSIRKPIFHKVFPSWDSKKCSKSLSPSKKSKIGKTHFFSGTPYYTYINIRQQQFLPHSKKGYSLITLWFGHSLPTCYC